MKDKKIAIIVSRFNSLITQALYEGAQAQLIKLGFRKEQLAVSWVPGAIEIPLIAQQYAKQVDYDAIIALGCVIRGQTSHYDVVCEQVASGCQRVALAHDIPVILGVLTTENKQQALARVGGDHGHKGVDAANAAVDMLSIMDNLSCQRTCGSDKKGVING